MSELDTPAQGGELVIQAPPQPPAVVVELSVDDILTRLKKIQQVQREAMTENVDFGVIPGTERKDKEGKDISKPTLLKPGAEKLCVLFRLDAQFSGPGNREVFEGGHLTVFRYCAIFHQVTGQRLGGASALCTSRESKYAWRRASRECPECGKAAIFKSKYPDRDTGDVGWYCNKYKGGCSANFKSNDTTITDQAEGRQPNEDIADSFNTVMRIAEKRALIAAVRLVTGGSAVFDEEMPEVEDTGNAAGAAGTAAPAGPEAKGVGEDGSANSKGGNKGSGKTGKARKAKATTGPAPGTIDGETLEALTNAYRDLIEITGDLDRVERFTQRMCQQFNMVRAADDWPDFQRIPPVGNKTSQQVAGTILSILQGALNRARQEMGINPEAANQ